MHRRIAPLFLAVLVALPVVAPVSAAGPSQSRPTDRRAQSPSRRPSRSDGGRADRRPEPEPAPAADVDGRPGRRAARTPRSDRPLHRHARATARTPRPPSSKARTRTASRPTGPSPEPSAASPPSSTSSQRRASLADPNVVAVVPDEVVRADRPDHPDRRRRGSAASRATSPAIDGVDDARRCGRRDRRHRASPPTRTSTSPAATTARPRDRTAWRDRNTTARTSPARSARSTTASASSASRPGARVWGVKILNDDGYGLLSWYVCGLDWILAQRDPTDASRPLFEAVNMSVTKDGSDDGNCGVDQQRHPPPGDLPRRRGRHHGRRRGGQRLAQRQPRTSRPPTTRSSPCPRWPTRTASPAASAATAATRGAATTRTTRSPTSATTAATSTSSRRASASGRRSRAAATPTVGHVDGRPDRRRRRRAVQGEPPHATPAEVKEALQYLGNLDWKTSTDPDAVHEKLLDVSRIGAARDVRRRARRRPTITGRGRRDGDGRRSRSSRSSTFFERVRFSVTSLPAGWTAPLDQSSLLGWTANSGARARRHPGRHAARSLRHRRHGPPTRAASRQRPSPSTS